MTELTHFAQTVRYDPGATAELYGRLITQGDADACGCASCRNFAHHRSAIYPQEFLALLRRLGIDAAKEWEAFDYGACDSDSSVHSYGGWFLFVGELVTGSEWRPDSSGAEFNYFFTNDFPTASFPHTRKICAVEFVVNVPWHPTTELHKV